MTSDLTMSQKNGKGKKGLPIISVILSVACAISLWFYVTSVEDPTYTKTFEGILVELKNKNVFENEGMRVQSGQNIYISVTVRGRRSDINRYTEDDIVAFADASSINVPNTYQLRVQTDVPEGLTVTDISSSSIEVRVDKTISKTIPIDQNVEVINYIPSGDCGIGTVKIVSDSVLRNPQEINIEGSVSDLDSIVIARVKDIDLGMSVVNEDFNVEVKGQLEFYDKNEELVDSTYITVPGGGLVTLNIPVTQKKTFGISVVFEDNAGVGDYDISYTPKEVTVIGERSEIRALGAEDFTLTIEGSAKSNLGTKKHKLVLPEVAELAAQAKDIGSLTEIEITVSVTEKDK